MIRTRDILAALGLLWLSSSAWNDQSITNSISGSIFLAFYLPHQQQQTSATSLATASTAVLDVDGDGTPEALALWQSKKATYVLQVLDLRPLSQQRSSSTQQAAPFQPNVLLESEAVLKEKPSSSAPLHMTTGQVLTKDVKKTAVASASDKTSEAAPADRTLQYFCGTTWHDAAERCAVHCPSGQLSDCPDGEKCFADTPCRAGKLKAGTTGNPVYDIMDSLHTTPAGGWPSVFTIWEDSFVTMHSLTASNSTDGMPASSSKRSRARVPQLQIKQMWQVMPLKPSFSGQNKTSIEIEWYDLAMEFIDALSAPADHGSNAGLLLLTGTVYARDTSMATQLPGEDDDYDRREKRSTFVVALDALTGSTVWESFSSTAVEKMIRGDPNEQDVPLPVVPTRGSTSAARRRSLVVPSTLQIGQDGKNSPTGTAVANCLRDYRGSLLTSSALPYQFHSMDDVRIQALHFDHQAVAHTAKGVKPPKQHERRSGGGSGRWLSNMFSKPRVLTGKHLNYGRPNVVVTHNEEGIQVRSLKNGRSLCHLSLQDGTLYADINHDGTVDSLQVVTSQKAAAQSAGDDDVALQERKWLFRLADKVSNQNQRNKNRKMEKEPKQMADYRMAQTPLCHLLALSGIPTKEELFSSNLCDSSKKGKTVVAMPHQSVQGAPLLVVEPTSRGGRHAQNHRGHDVVAAVNNGYVSRWRGNTGRPLWKRNGNRQYGSDFPTWDYDTLEFVLLDRVLSKYVTPSLRPIVLAGENSAALLAPGSGNLLGASSSGLAIFPQPSRARPQLVDFDGDGTVDLIVTTNDGIWGYKIVVTTGATAIFRIVVGLLIMGLMLAILRNRFGPHAGKRSTDL